MNKTRSITVLVQFVSMCVPILLHAGSRIACEDAVYNFGTAHEGSSVTNVFSIRNIGDAPLQIGKIRACCGATAKISAKSITPGSNAQLRVVLSLSHRRGKQNKSVYVASNDPNQPFTQLSLKGNVISSVYMNPTYLDLGKIKPNEKVQAESVLHVLSGLNCRILSVTQNSKYLETSVLSCPTSGVQKVRISTTGLLPVGVNRGLITVNTDNPKYSKLQLRTSVVVASDIVTVPREIILKVKDGELKPARRFISMKSRTKKQFSIKAVVLPDEKMTSDTRKISSGGYIVELNNVIPFPDLDGSNVLIRINHDDVDEIELPIRITYEDPVPYNVYIGREKVKVKEHRVLSVLNFGEVSSYRKMRKSFNIEFVPGVKVRIKTLKSTNPLFSAHYETSAGKTYRINVSTAAPVPYGKTTGDIQIVTDNKDFPVIEMPVSISCAESMTVGPLKLFLKEGVAPVSRHFSITHVDGEPFEIRRVTLAGKRVKYSAEKKDRGYILRLDNITPLADLDGKKLIIMTTCKKAAGIVLPVRVAK